MRLKRIAKFGFGAALLLALIVGGTLIAQRHNSALASACTTPATDYGQVSNLSVNIDTAGTYRIWTRMAAPDTTNHTYLLEIDGSTCFNVGGSSVPIYASGTTTHFANNSSNWIHVTSSGADVSLNLSVGTHSIKLIGNAPGVVLDRLIITSDTSCTPTGTGDNCITPPDTTAPVISGIATGGITSTSTTITWTTNEAADTQVAYGTSTSYGTTSTLVTTKVTTHSVSLSGLSPNTTYHYQVRSSDAAGNQATGADKTFTTAAPPDTTAPTISSIATSGVTTAGATITWTTNEAADTQVNYGTSTSYGSSTTLTSTPVTSHSVGLSGLTPGTTYHYQVRSRDPAGNLATGADHTFTTAAAGDTTPPTISAVASGSIDATSATITWTTNESADTQVAYGTSTSYGGLTTLVTTKVTNHSVTLNGLLPSTMYHYQVRSADAAGNLATTTDKTFTTAAVVTYPTGDANHDGHVNILDISLVVSKWGQTSSLGNADINNDGKVNILDISALIPHYGK